MHQGKEVKSVDLWCNLDRQVLDVSFTKSFSGYSQVRHRGLRPSLQPIEALNAYIEKR